MRVIDLISELNQQDIRLWLEEGQLRFSAPKDGMTEAVRDQLRKHRTEIITFLHQAQQRTPAPITPVAHDKPQVLSFAQERIWFLCQLEPNNRAFHLQNIFAIHGPLDITRLEKALTHIIERHSILRTAYRQTADGTFQQILPAGEVKLPCETTSGNPDVQALAREECDKPFDLAAGQVFRHRLLKLSGQHYLLISTLHHIATDGISQGLLADEIRTLYRQFGHSHPALPPTPPVQYIDYAVWQRRQTQNDTMADDLAYWRRTLEDVPPLSLPGDFPRPSITDSHGASVRFQLDNKTTTALHRLAQQHNATLYMTLLALFSTLLHRYSQQDDFCIGTPVAGRLHSQTENLIGCFVNMLAIRCRHDDDSFSQHLQRLRDTVQQAFAHQAAPFEQVVQQVVSTRDLSTAPVFQVMFALQSLTGDQQQSMDGISIDPIEVEKHSAQYDLSLLASETANGIEAELNYRTALFRPETIAGMAASLERLITAVTNDCTQALYRLPCISEADRQKQLAWNRTTVERDELPALHHYIERQADKTPDAVAVSHNGHCLTYQQLNRQANRLAHYLAAQNESSPVGLYLQRSLALPVAMLAVLKSGRACLPLNIEYPSERLHYICHDAGVKTVLTGSDMHKQALPQSIQQIRLDLDNERWQHAPDDNPNAGTAADAVFNIIYTSGSTGYPKGVVVPHKAIINRLLWMQETFPLTADDKVLHKTPYSFDVSVWEIFWPLMTGARLVIAGTGLHKSPAGLAQTIRENAVTVMHFVPSMLGVFLQHDQAAGCDSLQRVFCSGEALDASHVEAFFRTLPQAELYNLYGPTEAAIDVAWHPCQPGDDPVPIGRPIANTLLYIMDRHHQLLPTGAIGEICIGGRNLAKGYLNQPALTEQAFIDDPLQPGQKLYRSGDIGRLGHDGNLYYLGRRDQQVKIRGFRVELREIEQQLNRHPAVNESRVLASGDSLDDLRLIAYFISSAPAPDSQLLRRHLQQHLPDFMIPNHFIAITQWPVSASGKIAVDRLPDYRNRYPGDNARVLPRTETEKAVAAIWSELLHLEEIGVHDDFFSLGGHSLTATLAITRMQQHFNITIPLSDIFRDPSIATIAAVIDKAVQQQAINNDAGPADDEEEVRL